MTTNPRRAQGRPGEPPSPPHAAHTIRVARGVAQTTLGEIAQSRVRRGLHYLDRTVPNWWKHIDLGKLDVRYSHFCVAAQALGVPFYRTYMSKLWTEDELIAHGFLEARETTTAEVLDYVDALNFWWRWMIVDRQWIP